MAEHAKSEKRPIEVFDRPILSYFIVSFCTLIIFSLFSAVLQILGLEGTVADLFSLVSLIPSALVSILLVCKVFYRDTLKGIFTLEGTVDGLKMFIPLIVLNIVIFVIDRIFSGQNTLNDVLHVLALSCTAGVMEEIVFRAFVLPNFMRLKRDYKGMIFSVVFTALIFGFTHIANLTSGADVLRTIQQTITASISGVLFAAVYLNTGTIIPCMLFHAFHDVVNLLFMSMTEAGGMTEGITLYNLVQQIIFSGVELYMGVRLLRAANFDKIRAIWDKKWTL